jgi:hypothetical protein
VSFLRNYIINVTIVRVDSRINYICIGIANKLADLDKKELLATLQVPSQLYYAHCHYIMLTFTDLTSGVIRKEPS